MPKLKPRTSRRVPPPKDSDFDHEISLVDNTDADQQQDSGPAGGDTLCPAVSAPDTVSSQPLSSVVSIDASIDSRDGQTREGRTAKGSSQRVSIKRQSLDTEEVDIFPKDSRSQTGKQIATVRSIPAESAIDILYENQRGCFLCGIALFSSRALGNLDPPPWTNFAHKPSPTDIWTAQVPDPSWEWAWPEWRINHDIGTDEDGWEYSFMFSRKFSWHGPTWWNSFVRRRAWIRKRVKKNVASGPNDPDRLAPEYFTVRPASAASHSRSPSRADSLRGSKVDTSIMSFRTVKDEEEGKTDIENLESLLSALRATRIDRERIETVTNYLEHATDDLDGLSDEMHEIMSLFIFQTSRKILLTKLSKAYDETQKKLQNQQEAEDGEGDGAKLRRRANTLASALRHADEEIKRLEYWSDVKCIAEEGASKTAVDHQQGWDEGWQGLDKSGPAPPARPSDTSGPS
ncbi:hypothetical protein VTK73DRAFT_2860 [Phialemonium thermophilum]|uniref:Peroxin/Ferlin domain-containing protein n=1 Tax=Phialemonium thermophilum TaxID=223376 RepID=A0ABR3X2E2_9PEZI